jgi:hypothetical protein
MSDIKLCYSFSARVDKLGFIDLLHSLHTIKQYFSKEDIIVFFTPPFNDDYEQQIAKYATVIKKGHYPIPHPTYDPNDPTPPYYWDKFYFTEVDCDKLIFLDNDTEIQKDIREYFKEDFDILVFGDDGRSNTEFIDTWNDTWRYFQVAPKPLVMTTAILFKHQTHKKIKDNLGDIAHKYMIDKAIKMPAEDRLFDEYVFSLATRHYNVQIKPKSVDLIWTAVDGPVEPRNNATILHGGGRKFLRAGNTPTADKTFSANLLDYIEQDVPTKHWIERVAATFLAMLEDDYTNFDVHFSLDRNTIIMHTTAQLSQELIDKVYSYVWAEKPAQFNFDVRGHPI